MRIRTLPLLLGALLFGLPHRLLPQDPAPSMALRATVHPGVELVATLMWLAGRYPPPADSRYKTELWARFGRYRADPAVVRFRDLTGELYPDLTETGLLLNICGAPPVAQAPVIPSSLTRPDSSSWFRNYGRDSLLAALEGATRFATARGFCAFHQAHRREYAAWSRGLEADLARRHALDAVASFYNAPNAGTSVTVYLEPLNNWGAHAIDFSLLAGEAAAGRIAFLLGPDASAGRWPDSPISYLGDASMVSTVWHEASHTYLAPILASQAAAIDSLSRLFDPDDRQLQQQRITTWRYAFEENLVRAVVATLVGEAVGAEAGRREVRTQSERGFRYVPALADLIRTRYVGPVRQAGFAALLPEVFILLASQAGPTMPSPSPPP